MNQIFDQLYALKKTNNHILEFIKDISDLNKKYSRDLTNITKKYEKFPFQTDVKLSQFTDYLQIPMAEFSKDLLLQFQTSEKQRKAASEITRKIQSNYDKLLKRVKDAGQVQQNEAINQFYQQNRNNLQTCSDTQNLIGKQVIQDLERSKKMLIESIQQHSKPFYQHHSNQDTQKVEYLSNQFTETQLNNFQNNMTSNREQLEQTSTSKMVPYLDDISGDMTSQENQIEFGTAPIL